MDVFGFLHLNELALGLSNLSMFPCFDIAHYIISVMSLREQPGALEVSQRSPFACWFSSMLYCFGGAVLSALMMADAPVTPLTNTTNLLLASLMWSAGGLSAESVRLLVQFDAVLFQEELFSQRWMMADASGHTTDQHHQPAARLTDV
ncbi:trimeric intracellular cation channel type B-like, partial [Carassius auratus]|uniref:Trimeric intracellular cation channel type B-like n=1 Tax=Carassius auratus TaxID=7957 RepID=A0A6P6NBG9_CARAU